MNYSRDFGWTRLTLALLSALCLGLGGIDAAPAAAEPEIQYTEAELQSVKDALDQDTSAVIPGTAWEVDSAANRVVVSYDDGVTGDRMTQLQSITARYGAAVRLEHLPGALEPADSRTVGGNAIFGSTNPPGCSLGFNTIRSGIYYFITAGHCTKDSNYWYDNDNITQLGYRVTTHYDTRDYGVVRYTNTIIAKYGMVDQYDGTYQQISTSRYPVKDEFICRAGSITAKRCGRVGSTCSTVTYQDRTKLLCMIRATACGNHGDSGGPMWSGEAALGIFSGGHLGCGKYPGGPTYYMPVQQILTDHGLRVF